MEIDSAKPFELYNSSRVLRDVEKAVGIHSYAFLVVSWQGVYAQEPMAARILEYQVCSITDDHDMVRCRIIVETRQINDAGLEIPRNPRLASLRAKRQFRLEHRREVMLVRKGKDLSAVLQ